MEEVIRTRLKIISDSVESLTKSASDAIVKLKENQMTSEEARVVASKLKVMNERFVSEMYNYFKLIQQPSADEISRYTSIQMQADELIAEIDTRSQIQKPSSSFTPYGESLHVASRLPQMVLAKFDGDVLKWHQFWDQFSSNVDSRNLNDVDKLLYLQSVLSGEAKQAIEGLDTTNKNYNIAVETLKERYGKPTAIIDAHYVALYRIRTAGNTAKDCRNVLNEIERHLRVLKSLGEDVNHNHLRVMIMEKFPEDLIYELRVKLGAEDESIDTIRKNLEHIISARETSNRLKRETSNTQGTGEKFTLDTLHVRTVKTASQEGFIRKQPFKQGRNRMYENKSFGRQNPRKRSFGDQKSKQGEPIVKRSKISCIFCHSDHFNDECLNVKTVQERKQKLKGRCFNCFGENHMANDCKFKRKCWHCGVFGLHNRALCSNKIIESNRTNVMHSKVDKSMTILQTCTASIYNISDRFRRLNCRVLLDCGSQRSYITTEVANKLKLPVVEENRLSVFTFGAKAPLVIESPLVEFELLTRLNKIRTIYANVVPHITRNVACPYGKIQELKTIPNMDQLILADDGSRDDSVDILLGNDYYYSFMYQQKLQVSQDLFLVESDFGWIWSGRSPSYGNDKGDLSVVTYFQASHEIETHFYEPDLPLRNDNLKQLWDLESIGIVDSPKCSREDEAMKTFNETTVLQDSRYHVKWPWTEYPPTKLPINFGMALGRLNSLLKRLEVDTIRAYDAVLQDQLTKGIIEKVNETELPKNHPVHYLPHHCVSQIGKSLRVVYDGSSKTKDTCSLNECLYRGPLLLEDLTGIIIRFREHPVGIVADVEKAFLQIGLQDEDRDCTRFLWIKNVNKAATPDNIQHFRFCRVPFGVISSPFLLNATIKYHLNQSQNKINLQLAEDIYVDNLVTGAQSINDALTVYNTAKTTFNDISMNLRAWNSNSKELMAQIPQQYHDEKNDKVKILGIEWDIIRDELKLKPNCDKSVEDMYTKRGILKVVASIYDPCGFVAPIVLPAKLLLQDLWRNKLKWDEPLTTDFLKNWQSISAKMKEIKTISIPRTYSGINTDRDQSEMEYELHCFADASLQAYAAVVYLRVYSKGEDSVFVSFIIGKSRLAPIKNKNDLQIPRLELLGAVIGNRLLQYAAKYLRLKIRGQYLWVDSEIVLSWYSSEKLLPPFISRRIKEIKLNENLIMKHVPSKLNSADVATRPIESLDCNDIWLGGPEFLMQRTENWPKGSMDTRIKNFTQVQTSVEEGLLQGNGYMRDVRDTDDIARSEESLYKETSMEVNDVGDRNKNRLHLEDITDQILKLQKEYFPKEVQGLKTDLKLSLRVFKDENGILRCGGRFQNAEWTDERKNPILLPKNTDFTTKVIENAHRENYHVGVGHTLGIVRNKYWILQGRSQVQKVLRNCVPCRKEGGGPYKIPVMPPLPVERVRYSAAFTFTGLDYFGPLTVQEGGQTEKRWVCLFTCLAVRAIHLEVVKDLSSEECIMAIRRFGAVRGLPQVIISDNATQFKLTSSVITSNYCIRNKISWRFIPELAPWFGGFYERLIGIVKNCLRRTLDKHLLNNNQLCTIMKEVEAVVNTRPLTAVGQDLEHILTPADFLRIGGPLVNEVSDTDFLENATVTKDNLVMGWKRSQLILEEYVKMFTSQYLTSLRERKNVHKQSRVAVDRIPKIGDLVQIKNDQNRALWKVGRITSVKASSDGQIRVAKVTMPSGETLTRSVGHLYPLELEDKDDAQSEKPHQALQPNTTVKDTQTPLDSVKDKIHQSPTSIEIEDDGISDSVTRENSVDAVTDEVVRHLGTRPKRSSARVAREKIKQWTQQLITLILV